MMGRILRLSPMAALVFALAACGGTKTVTVTQTVTTTVGGASDLIKAPVRVYFTRNGKVAPVARTLPISNFWLLRALVFGPTPAETQLGFSLGRQGSRTPLAETVYTLSQFAPEEPVTVGGKQYTRAEFEGETPPILVEAPLPFQAVHGPELHASGTANTFEATFEYDLVGADGRVIAHHFVTATSGSGTRGTFDFSVPFTVARSGIGKLVVFESSAENGQRIHVVEIPLRLEP